MGSSRLPGKVMMEVRGKPLLYYIINQVKHSKKLDNLVIATTTLQEDDKIVNYVELLEENVFRGSSENVLDRYYQCATKFKADVIVRVTSDCPLIDPEVIDKCICEFEKSNLDYLSNINRKEGSKWIYHPSGFPLGFAVEVFKYITLERAWKKAKKPSEKEHVTQYILNNPNEFKIGNVENFEDQSDIRLTVDYMVDFQVVKAVIENFKGEIFSMKKVTSFINKNSHLKQMNSNIPFNEGYLKSLKEDELAEKD